MSQKTSEPVIDSPGNSWMAVYIAMRMGRRGLPGGSSLSTLLMGACQRLCPPENARTVHLGLSHLYGADVGQ
jgi:hypothetical protein